QDHRGHWLDDGHAGAYRRGDPLVYQVGLASADRHFFLLIRPPPGSTLFPYTTLFRSGVAARRQRPVASAGSSARRSAACGTRGTDRKSTRLNSSHVEISYAVFCLKKKNLRLLAQPLVEALEQRPTPGEHDPTVHDVRR